VTAYLLLAALAWTVASRGGTSLRDLLVVSLLLVVAMIAGRAWPRRTVAVWAALAALVGWLLIDGPLRVGFELETVRMPLLVAIAAMTVLVVRRLNVAGRETLLSGLIAVGCLQSVIALGELAATAPFDLTAAPRASALLGSPNGLGILLVATSVLTARELHRRGGVLLIAALVLQGCALIATGSRTAILVGSILLIGYLATRTEWIYRALAAAGLAAGAAMVIWRTATEPHHDRPHLWGEALRRIADQPLVGEGPASAPFSPAAPGAGITTHAHNELLQWAMEYGLVGLGLALLVLVLAFRSVGRPLGGDRWVTFAALAVLAAGLTDFTLRITALTLAAAALVALAMPHPDPAASPTAPVDRFRAAAGRGRL